MSGTSADAAQQAATSATAPRRSVAAAEGSKPASTRGSVAKLILGNPEGRRSAASLGQQSARPSDFGAEDDLGVYDLEVIAARFPHMPLAFVLECERKFIEADNDQSGVRAGGEEEEEGRRETGPERTRVKSAGNGIRKKGEGTRQQKSGRPWLERLSPGQKREPWLEARRCAPRAPASHRLELDAAALPLVRPCPPSWWTSQSWPPSSRRPRCKTRR